MPYAYAVCVEWLVVLVMVSCSFTYSLTLFSVSAKVHVVGCTQNIIGRENHALYVVFGGGGGHSANISIPPSPVCDCINLQADLRLPRGVGEKRLLREVATSLGCHVGAAAPKRAIQFGSRVAKVTGSAGEQGSDICSRLK